MQNKNISYKGYVGNTVINDMAKCTKSLEYRLNLAKTNPQKYPTIINFLESRIAYSSNYAQNIIKNMNTIMSRFGKSCELTLKQSKKYPDKKLFVIESKDSDYKHICGEIEYRYNADALKIVDEFSTENLAKINPYETNVKFMEMWEPHEVTSSEIASCKENHSLPQDFADTFAAEKEIWFIEDELINASDRAEDNSVKIKVAGWDDIKEFSDKLKKENDDFIQEFEKG